MPHPDTHQVIRELIDSCTSDAVKARESMEAAVHDAFVATAFNIADQAVICDIESYGIPQRDADGTTWYDISALLDPREHAPESIDMASQALAFALGRQLFQPHDQFPNLWRKAVRT